ncbi:hypothetical protein CHH91_00015 [Virgibacillus sp. 7505]|nr:hypothetical protein CHH91_00015 [Virgibacillus sp. 7505]
MGLILSEYNSESFSEYNNIFYYKYKRHPLYFFKAAYRINKYIEKFKPDVIHIHSTFAGLFVRFPLLFNKKKCKVVYCSHGWSFLMEGSKLRNKVFVFVEKILSKRTDLIINISNNELDQSLKRNLPKDKSVVIYNGIKDSFNESDIELEMDNNKINLLYVGRFDYAKGIDIIIDYFEKYDTENLNLYVIGEGVLSKTQFETNVKTNIHFLGWVDNKELDSYYKSADAVIMPSRWEGFGLVAIEAMKNSTPVIASNRGALSEIIDDGYNGKIFNIENLNTLEQILKTTSKMEYQRMGRNGRINYKDNFTSEIMNQDIISNYKKIIKKY